MTEPLAYHITWTTYGTWLHGDHRGWVQDGVLEIQPANPEKEDDARKSMKEAALVLSTEQRSLVKQVIQDHCRMRGWTLHALNVRTNHVHIVVTADRHPDEVMNQLKAWTSRKLSDQAGLVKRIAAKAGRKKWWTEHGSTKYINDPDYLENAINYVNDLQ